MEIGIGLGACLKAVADYVDSLGVAFWRLHGVDLPGLTGPAKDPQTYYPHKFGVRGKRDAEGAQAKSIGVYLTSADVFLAGNRMTFDYAFIDACHGKPCVIADFLGVEPLIRRGGIVAFHDTGIACQGTHPQPHCGTGIDARAAVDELGLLDGSRDGWEVYAETEGDTSKGGHGSLWVRKL